MRNVIKYLFKLYLIVIFLQTVSVCSVYAEPELTVDGFEWDHIMTQDIIPDTSNSYDIGSSAFPAASIHVSTGSVFLGANELTAVGGAVGDFLYNGVPVSDGSGGVIPTVFYVETAVQHIALSNETALIANLIFSNVPPAVYKYHVNSKMIQQNTDREDRFALRIDGVELSITERNVKWKAGNQYVLDLYGIISITGVSNVIVDVIRDGFLGTGDSTFDDRNFSLQKVTLGTF